MVKITETMKSNYNLLSNLIKLKEKRDLSKDRSDKHNYDMAFRNAMTKFGYIVDMHSTRYKSFPNYPDIVQEGNIGLAFALEKFDPVRSKNFFKIANWYVKTRIKRSANKYGVVSIPINSKEKITINRVADLNLIIENKETPLDSFEKEDVMLRLKKAIRSLQEPYKTIVCFYYGIVVDKRMTKSRKKMTLNKISKVLKLEKEETEVLLEEAHKKLAHSKYLLCLLEEKND